MGNKTKRAKRAKLKAKQTRLERSQLKRKTTTFSVSDENKKRFAQMQPSLDFETFVIQIDGDLKKVANESTDPEMTYLTFYAMYRNAHPETHINNLI